MFPVKKLAQRALNFVLIGVLAIGIGCGPFSERKPVSPPPTMDIQPQSVSVLAGQPVVFTAWAGGQLPFSYQWRKDGTAIPGATATTYAIAAAQTADVGAYSVVVTNSGGTITSNNAMLSVNSTPGITTQPVAVSVTAGQSAQFTVVATGPAPLTYQWQKDGAAISGATSTSHAITVVQAGDAGSYRVVVTNPFGSTTSSAAALTVNAPLAVAPSITTQPQAATVVAGQPASFAVTAAGTAPLTYQWQKDGTTLPGATSATHTIASSQSADAGAYAVVVTNSAGSVTSNAATLTVTPAVAGPSITTQPQTQVLTAPDSPTFTVVATGSNLTYQWKQNGTAILAATAAAYTVPGFTDLQTVAASYTVVVSNGTSVESTSATFSVVAPNPFYLPGGEPIAVPNRPLTVLPSLVVDAVKFPNGAFRLGYDEELKNPAWTAYGDFKVNTTYANSSGSYQTDTRLAPTQVAPADMGTHGGSGFFLANGQGFDRGHMVTRSDLSYRYGTQAGDDATYMSDMIPQVSYFNQRLWNDLEEAVGGRMSGSTFTNGLTATFGRVWVYTGPVFTGTTSYWVPSTETYTTNRAGLALGILAIAIPTASYRIMVAEPAQGQTLPRVMAWVSSNRSYATAETADMWKYVTSVQRIESLTGLDFFPSLTHDAALTTWKASVDVRGWGTSFEKPTGPNVQIIQPSWDLLPMVGNPVLLGDSVNVGDTVTLEAAVSPNLGGGTIDPATGCTWTFGDGTPTGAGLTTNHVYSTTGSYTVTFSATDSLSQSNAITRVITVVGISANTPPTFTPSTLSNVTATAGVAIPNVTFSLTDDRTAPGSILVAAASDNQTLLLDSGIIPVNTNGNVSMPLTPIVGQAGMATVTVTATDTDGSPTVKTFTMTINANNPPTFTPSTLADVSMAMNATKLVTFTLADDLTAPGALVVSAASNNQTLLPDATIAVSNSAGSVTLTLTPALGQVGAALITVVATDGDGAATTKTFTLTVNAASHVLTEDFESGVKAAYVTGNVTLTSGIWTLNNAVLGILANDKKNGLQSVRSKTGTVTMAFDWQYGAQTVTVNQAKYGTDADSTWELWYSTDGGANWTITGSAMVTNSTTLTAASFTVNVAGPIRFEFRNKTVSSTARLNLDDFQINGY